MRAPVPSAISVRSVAILVCGWFPRFLIGCISKPILCRDDNETLNTTKLFPSPRANRISRALLGGLILSSKTRLRVLPNRARIYIRVIANICNKTFQTKCSDRF